MTSSKPMTHRTIISGKRLDTGDHTTLFSLGKAASVVPGVPAYIRPLEHPGLFDFAWLDGESDTASVRQRTIKTAEACYGLCHNGTIMAAVAGDADARSSVRHGVSIAWEQYDEEHRKEPYEFLRTYPRRVKWTYADHWLRKAAAQGDVDALHNFGWLHYSGHSVHDGLTPDTLLAFTRLHAAADSLAPESLDLLADCYEEGIGTKKDPERAASLRQLAREAEAAEATKQDAKAPEPAKSGTA